MQREFLEKNQSLSKILDVAQIDRTIGEIHHNHGVTIAEMNRPQEALRVNVHEAYEVEYWTKKLGCAAEQLKATVNKVGVMAKAVEAELKWR